MGRHESFDFGGRCSNISLAALREFLLVLLRLVRNQYQPVKDS
jgi:hypothetical protein